MIILLKGHAVLCASRASLRSVQPVVYATRKLRLHAVPHHQVNSTTHTDVNSCAMEQLEDGLDTQARILCNRRLLSRAKDTPMGVEHTSS
jgi:hypothetical protein